MRDKMFWAINETTRERVNSFTLELNGSYQLMREDTWFADPCSIDSYDKEKNPDIEKIIVKFRKGTDDAISRLGNHYTISPHFFIPNKEKLGINLKPESKEHKLIKNWIYNRIKNKTLKFKYSTVGNPLQYDNFLDENEIILDFTKLTWECPVSDNHTIQKADIFIPFMKWNNLFGAGIVIEIQFTDQYERTEIKRTIGWATKGYSVVWLYKDDFETISDDFIDMKDDFLKLNTMEGIIKDYDEYSRKENMAHTQHQFRLIDNKFNEKKEKLDKERAEVEAQIKSHTIYTQRSNSAFSTNIDIKKDKALDELEKKYSEIEHQIKNNQEELLMREGFFDEINQKTHSIVESIEKKGNDVEKKLSMSFDMVDGLIDKIEHLPLPQVLHRCPKCKEGMLLLRKGHYGNFYGCSLFKERGCDYKVSIAQNGSN